MVQVDIHRSAHSTFASPRPDLGDAVDAADGVMDGAFFGRPIVRCAERQHVPAR